MDIRTYRAASMHEALSLVRKELGPEASILHTREVRTSRLFGLLPGVRQIEVTASTAVHVPSRLPSGGGPSAPAPSRPEGHDPQSARAHAPNGRIGATDHALRRELSPAMSEGLDLMTSTWSAPDPSESSDGDMRGQLAQMQRMLQDLYQKTQSTPQHDWPEPLFRVFAELIDADIEENEARQMVERVRHEAGTSELNDLLLLKARLARMVESDLQVCGPIRISNDSRRVAALVGPTGVGKTTTIAKLAANYRLRENRSVGLITVDTYRIAAVEQLRTYAEIIDLPMEVVSSPREMREAVRKLSHVDLVLMDTAGRSPRDSIKIRELRAFLNEAQADEVHLVLSSVSGRKSLQRTIEQFQAVEPTAMVLTKLDEAPGLGGLLAVLRDGGLPLSYLTNGQSVPDDIETAHAGRVARMILGMEATTGT